MPNALTHRTVTRHAVRLAGSKNAEQLIETYCIYPDLYYGMEKNNIAPYLFMDGDVGFHDIPPSSITTLYQFWIPDDNGILHRGREYRNESYLFTEKCFRFYFENIKKTIDNGNLDDTMKFTGCLIHHLQDATFGLHVLEGASGADVYLLNRLSGKNFMKYIFELELQEQWQDNFARPHYLGDTVSEAVMRLCAQYVNYNKTSCNALFEIAANYVSKKDPAILDENAEKMYCSSLGATLDILHTINCWIEGKTAFPEPLSISCLAPYEPPLGGAGKYCHKMLETKENSLSFGVHFEQNLLYHIAEEVFSDFTCILIAEGNNEVKVNVINKGSTVDSFCLKNGETKNIRVDTPGGIFGFRTSSTSPAGTLTLKHGIFNRRQQ